MKKWHFPLINPVKIFTIGHYLDHIKQEIKEVEEEPDDFKRAKEVIDVLHAAETFARKYFEQNKDYSFEEMKKLVVQKNRKRGYYKE